MLGKLIKYEFKATRKMFLMYGLLLVLAIVMALSLRFSFRTDAGTIVDAAIRKAYLSGVAGFFVFIVSAAYAFMNAFIFAAVLFVAINRFRVNLLGNQGYLMHTLPVKAEHHILTKNIVSLVWTILGVISLLLSYVIIGVILMDGKNLELLFRELFSSNTLRIIFSNAKLWITLVELSVLTVISISELYFRIYASMAVGYSLNKHRAVASVGTFVALSIAKSMPHSIILTNIANLMYASSMDTLLIFEIGYAVVWGLVYYFITAWFLNKRLNLQ